MSGTATPATALEFPWPSVPAPAEALEVADGVYWLRMPLPFVLDHINLWLLRDDDGWVIVDSGIARDEVRGIWRQLIADTLGGERVTRIIVTHYHPDHIGLASWLMQETGAPACLTRTEWLTAQYMYNDIDNVNHREQVALYSHHGLQPKWTGSMAGRANPYRKIIERPPTIYTRLQHGEEFKVSEHRWRVIVTHGHAPEHACLYNDSLQVLIAGDQVLPKISPNVMLKASQPGGDPLRSFLDSMQRFDHLPAPTLVLPSHGLPFRGLATRIGQLREHHDERLELLHQHLEKPATAADLLPVMFKRELDEHQLMFAMGECLAHLVWLESAGRVTRCTRDGICYFVHQEVEG